MSHCPICHTNLSFGPARAEIVCNRCGSDLTLLFTIKQQAHKLLEMAGEHFVSGRKLDAISHVERSMVLSNNSLARAMYTFFSMT